MSNQRLGVFLTALLFTLGITSCSDSEIVPANNAAPVITLSSPSDATGNLSYQRGETIEIRGSIEDDEELQSYSISLYGPSDVDLDQNAEDNNVNSPTVYINQNITIPADAPTAYYQLVILGTDTKGNTAKKVFVTQIR